MCGLGSPVSAVWETGWGVESATWQALGNVMLIWQAQAGYTYNIYHAETRIGPYARIGTASGGSYRGGDAQWPAAGRYTVEPVSPAGAAEGRSAPIQAGTNPQRISKISVIMYHNFITEADEAQGVEFEEYSLRPADFAADFQYLRANGYTTITSVDLLDYINGVKPLPAKAVILSIDDGTQSLYANA